MGSPFCPEKYKERIRELKDQNDQICELKNRIVQLETVAKSNKHKIDALKNVSNFFIHKILDLEN